MPIELYLLLKIDRSTTNKYEQYISGTQEHLTKDKVFLQTVIPFYKFRSRLVSFGKGIVVPIITYMVGTYSSKISQIEISTAVVWMVSVVIILGFWYVAFNICTQIMQKIVNLISEPASHARNYLGPSHREIRRRAPASR